MPPSEMIATSVVPPPMSTIMFPVGSATGRPAPIAAAIGSSIRYAWRAPAESVASSTARFSTPVTPEGTHTTTRGCAKRCWCTFWMKCRSICSVTSKSAMTPSFSGRIAEIVPGVLPSMRFASTPTACTSPVRWSIATTDGSESTIPRPRTYTSVLAVPRSTAMSRPPKPVRDLNQAMGARVYLCLFQQISARAARAARGEARPGAPRRSGSRPRSARRAVRRAPGSRTRPRGPPTPHSPDTSSRSSAVRGLNVTCGDLVHDDVELGAEQAEAGHDHVRPPGEALAASAVALDVRRLAVDPPVEHDRRVDAQRHSTVRVNRVRLSLARACARARPARDRADRARRTPERTTSNGIRSCSRIARRCGLVEARIRRSCVPPTDLLARPLARPLRRGGVVVLVRPSRLRARRAPRAARPRSPPRGAGR